MAQAFIQTNISARTLADTHKYVHSIHTLLSMHETSEKLPHTHDFLPFGRLKVQFRSVAVYIISLLLGLFLLVIPVLLFIGFFVSAFMCKNIVLSTTTLPKYDQSLESSSLGHGACILLYCICFIWFCTWARFHIVMPWPWPYRILLKAAKGECGIVNLVDPPYRWSYTPTSNLAERDSLKILNCHYFSFSTFDSLTGQPNGMFVRLVDVHESVYINRKARGSETAAQASISASIRQ